ESWLSVHPNNAPDSEKCLHPSFEALARRREIREVRTRVTTGARYCDQFGLWLSLVERLVRDERAPRGGVRFSLVRNRAEPSGNGQQTREETRERRVPSPPRPASQ